MGNTHGKPETALLIYLKEKKKKNLLLSPLLLKNFHKKERVKGRGGTDSIKKGIKNRSVIDHQGSSHL